MATTLGRRIYRQLDETADEGPETVDLKGVWEVNFYVTQLLSIRFTVHNCFGPYLYSMNRVRTPVCKYCEHKWGDAKYTFFECDRWTTLRRRVETTVDNITPDYIVELMVYTIEWWQPHYLRRDEPKTKNVDCSLVWQSYRTAVAENE